MPLVAITRLRLRSLRFFPPFVIYAIRSRSQALASDGCLAVDVRTIRYRVFWTRTLWRDAPSMQDYMRSGAHGAAMPKLMHWCDEASVAQWEDDALADWNAAETHLREHGRLSKVRHPSPAQSRGETLPGDAG